MLKKLIIISIFAFSMGASANAPASSGKSVSPVIDQEVTGINLQQLEYKAITNSNGLLKNQNIESTNMEIIGDSLKKQRQRIKVVQSDSVQLQDEITEGKKKGFFGSLFN